MTSNLPPTTQPTAWKMKSHKPNYASVGNLHFKTTESEYDAFFADFLALINNGEEGKAAQEEAFAVKWAHLKVEPPNYPDARESNGRSRAMNQKLGDLKARMEKE